MFLRLALADMVLQSTIVSPVLGRAFAAISQSASGDSLSLEPAYSLLPGTGLLLTSLPPWNLSPWNRLTSPAEPVQQATNKHSLTDETSARKQR